MTVDKFTKLLDEKNPQEGARGERRGRQRQQEEEQQQRLQVVRRGKPIAHQIKTRRQNATITMPRVTRIASLPLSRSYCAMISKRNNLASRIFLSPLSCCKSNESSQSSTLYKTNNSSPESTKCAPNALLHTTTFQAAKRAAKSHQKLSLALLVLVACALATSSSSPFIVVPTSALATSASDHQVPSNAPSSSSSSAEGKQLSARLDSAPVSSSSSSSASAAASADNKASIVASLSSAVATAAAAAAVAAAQSGLSGSDGRSLLSSSAQHAANQHLHHRRQQQQRSQGLNLALKLVDTIPEVPYSILHNMKKLDHAAPFYNVPNKLTAAGSSKESSHGLLATALSSASGGFSGAAVDQLASLFKSPLWKRISDGYGEFTSEFRSLFRAPPTTMKGPTSSAATKLLRDISVPALLMLLATSIPTDWRPVRTRRKSLAPAIDAAASLPLSNIVDPMSTSASGELISGYNSMLNLAPTGFGAKNFAHTAAANLALQEAIARGSSSFNEHVATGQARAGQGVEQANQWISAAQQQNRNFPATANVDSPQTRDILQPIRRVGDSRNGNLNVATEFRQAQQSQLDSQARESKPVEDDDDDGQRLGSGKMHQKSGVAGGGLFSSLTSLNGGQSKLMSKIMNANGNENYQLSNSYPYILSLLSNERNGGELSPLARRGDLGSSLLNDKQRYSLVEGNSEEETEKSTSFGIGEQGKMYSQQASKPFLLSAMTQAISSMLTNSLPSAAAQKQTESGSYKLFGASSGKQQADVDTERQTLKQQPSQHHLIGEKTNHLTGASATNQINHNRATDSLTRRQQHGSGNDPIFVGEQRELSQLIPQSWRQVVKRTVNNVQQQATSQWKSIEGQLTTWVQDKLKAFPASITPSSGGNSSPATAASPAVPVASIIASVSSTAMNILGLGNKGASSPASQPASAASPQVGAPTAAAGGELTGASSEPNASTTSGQKAKADSPNRSSSANQPAKQSALVGVANMIVNTLTSRQQTAALPAPQSISSSSAASASGPKQAEADPSPLSSAVSGVIASQYPTLTGSQTPTM